MVPGQRLQFGHFALSLPLQRRRSRRRNHSAAPVEEHHRAGLPDLQTGEKLREPFQLDDDRDDAGKIEVYDDRRRGDDRRPIAVGEMREHAPAGAVLCDGALVPGLRRRLVVARSDLAPAKHHVARLGSVGVDPLLPNSRLRVPLHLDHVDLVVAGFERAEEGPVGKAEGDPRERRMRPQQREEDEFALGLVGGLDGLLEKDRLHRLLHRPGVIQGPADFVLHRSDDLTVELADNIGDIPSSVVEPGQVDQDSGDRHCQQHQAGQRRPQPELARLRALRRREGKRRGVARRAGPDGWGQARLGPQPRHRCRSSEPFLRRRRWA